MKQLLLLLLLGFYPGYIISNTAVESKLVKISENGDITYTADPDGFVIPDFSNAGYKNGEDIPDVQLPAERIIEIAPLAGVDNSTHIQDAIKKAEKLPVNEDGYRAIVSFKPGKYLTDTIIYVRKSGIILRGAGNGSDPATSTIIYRRNAINKETSIIWLGSERGNRWGQGNGANKTVITTPKVMPGDYSFEVADASKHKVGDNICIKFPTTDKWLADIWYGGNSDSKKKWTVDNIDISYHRYIKKIEGNRITVDAPVFYTLDSKYAQSYIYKIPTNDTRSTIVYNVGIENMRLEMERTPSTSSIVASQGCVYMCCLENSWAKDLYLTGYVQSGIRTHGTTRTTIQDCTSVDPSGKITGGQGYNFETYQNSQLILIKDCYARGGRHHYISTGSATVSGIVVLNMRSEQSNGCAEGHAWLSQGILFDKWTESGASTYRIGFYLRDNMGSSGHGWGAVHSVLWNCDMGSGSIYLDKVPTGQNYAIYCKASSIRKFNNTSKYTTGYVEGKGASGIAPASLYEAQLEFRKKNENGAGISLVENEQQPIKLMVSADYKINVEAYETGMISVYSIMGALIETKRINSGSQIDISVNPDKLYVVCFQGNKSGRYSKVISTHF